MRSVVQRVAWARVSVGGAVVGEIGPGLLALVAIAPGDDRGSCRWLADKLANLRIFPDERGRMDRSLLDAGHGVLAISQFTLYGDCRKGRRPSFVGAAPPEVAEPLYRAFCEELEALGVGRVGRGIFAADMAVELHNDGPVTLVIDTP